MKVHGCSNLVPPISPSLPQAVESDEGPVDYAATVFKLPEQLLHFSIGDPYGAGNYVDVFVAVQNDALYT